jgi:uncharacterized membrane protein
MSGARRRFDTGDLEPRAIPDVFSRPVSAPGVLTGVFFFALSLFPSMLPRTGIVQGVISGGTVMIGYAIGAGWEWAWHYLEIPSPGGRTWQYIRGVWLIVLAFLVASAMWQHVGWQNNVRDIMGMDRIAPTIWLTIIPVAGMVAALILIVVRSLRKLLHFITRWLDKALPARLARFLGITVLVLILWGLYSGVLVNGFFAVANAMFEPRDASTNEGNEIPITELRSAGPGSLVSWGDLGRQGRAFVSTGPTVDELNEFHGGGAMLPIRVYVGLKSAETLEQRAELLLEELKRTGAFERENLIVATTTGTGYLEPNAMTALDYATNGNVAVAGVQYSYLPSWISLLADQEKVRLTSKVVFDTVHSYWSTLPEDSRPEIYAYGLSLGSFGVETILTSIDVLNEPIDGAMMVGPPFVNPLHDEVVANRQPGTTPETPIFEDGRTIRFTNEESGLTSPEGAWGDTRVVYLQHATDPVVWFSPRLVLNEPDWLLDDQKADTLTQDFVWFPFVTGWQMLLDMAGAAAVPEGFGHLYSKQANADAWVAVLRPSGMTDAKAADLRDFLIGLGPLE